MDSNQTIESLFSKYIEETIVYALTHGINFRYEAGESHTHVTRLEELVDCYVQDYIKLFEKHKTIILSEDNEEEIDEIVCEFTNTIEILNAMHGDDRDFAEKKILSCFDKIREIGHLFSSEPTITIEEIEQGVCCFCNEECNPLSQSCGHCARGLSGVALGLPVPEHLQKFIYF